MKRKADIFFFFFFVSLVQDFILVTLVKFLLCFGLGKVSLIILSLVILVSLVIIFNAQRITECKSKLNVAMAT